MPFLGNITCYGALLHNLPLLLWPPVIRHLIHILLLCFARPAQLGCLICTSLLSAEGSGCMSCKVFASMLSSGTAFGFISCLIESLLHLPKLLSLPLLLLVLEQPGRLCKTSACSAGGAVCKRCLLSHCTAALLSCVGSLAVQVAVFVPASVQLECMQSNLLSI